MEKGEIYRELKSLRTQVKGILSIVDSLILDVGIEVEQEEMEWKGPGGRPDGCPAA